MIYVDKLAVMAAEKEVLKAEKSELPSTISSQKKASCIECFPVSPELVDPGLLRLLVRLSFESRDDERIKGQRYQSTDKSFNSGFCFLINSSL